MSFSPDGLALLLGELAEVCHVARGEVLIAGLRFARQAAFQEHGGLLGRIEDQLLGGLGIGDHHAGRRPGRPRCAAARAP